ncbi:MAG: hypothetical protein WA715_06245 [Candidatus Acidiferrum sp.]
MEIRMRVTISLGLLLFFSANVIAQNPSCEADVLVNVVLPDGGLVRDIHEDAFIARRGAEQLTIRSVDVDAGPRRIVLVVENGKNVNADARKVEAGVLRAIVTNARTVDSFSFLTAIGPRKEVPLGAPREVLLSAIDELSSPSKGSGQARPILDAVLEAATWLQPVQPGDSIVCLTMGLKPDEPKYGSAGKKLTSAGIRLFGFQLGTWYTGIYSIGVAPGVGMRPAARVDPNHESIFNLADETGGFAILENTEGGPQQTYKLTDERLRYLVKYAGQLYKGITNYYRIRVVSPPENFVIDLSESVREKVPKAYMVYARKTPILFIDRTAN